MLLAPLRITDRRISAGNVFATPCGCYSKGTCVSMGCKYLNRSGAFAGLSPAGGQGFRCSAVPFSTCCRINARPVAAATAMGRAIFLAARSLAQLRDARQRSSGCLLVSARTRCLPFSSGSAG